MSRLRGYQTTNKNGVYHEWNAGHRNVVPVIPTGGGKTVEVGEIIREFDAPTIAIAHRQELVSQISTALAREGIRHALLAPKDTRNSIIAAHIEKLGHHFIDPHSKVKVGGVDTVIRMSQDDPWFKSVGLVVQDEGHHVLRINKWGRAMNMFPNAYGLFPTAWPNRADGLGLSRATDGLADALVLGPSMRELIDWGYLTDYRVVCPRPSVDMTGVEVSETTGDFNKDQARKAVHASATLVGDVVKEYLRWAPGKLGVTFAIDVESAVEIAEAFRRAGVPAEVVHAGTKDDLRRSILRRFANREILQLVNVDLFGEGFDLPAIEVVSMARPTQSFSLYLQQFGRSVRLMISDILQAAWDTYSVEQRLNFIAHSTKPKAMVIDHVSNIERHGLPDRPRVPSLERREKRSKLSVTDAIPLRICINPECAFPYERVLKCCPYCGLAPVPADRSSIAAVDGDLEELDEETLKIMRGEVAKIDGPAPNLSHLGAATNGAAWRNHNERQQAQRDLRHAMDCWAATHEGEPLSMLYRRFYFIFGIDVLSAKALNAQDARVLYGRIELRLAIDGFVIREQNPPEPLQLQVA